MSYTITTDSDSGLFGIFILYRIREVFRSVDYSESVPAYAEMIGISEDNMLSAINGTELPPLALLEDMAKSDTMGLRVESFYRYKITLGNPRGKA